MSVVPRHGFNDQLWLVQINETIKPEESDAVSKVQIDMAFLSQVFSMQVLTSQLYNI